MSFKTPTISLKKQYLEIRSKTAAICAPLQTEDFVAQPIVDVSPPKWHLGHTTWFFENFILKDNFKNYHLFNEHFAFIFNSYYESQGARILRNKRGTLTRPSTDEIFSYRKYVDDFMFQLLENENQLTHKLKQFIEIGLNHEQQHQELLLTDIKYILGSNPFPSAYSEFSPVEKNAIKDEWLKIENGEYPIGYKGDHFCFDNELGRHQVYLHEFECMNRLATNSEFIGFIEDGGYQRSELWLSEGWEWVKQNNVSSPLYWFKQDKDWYNYQLNGIQKVLPLSAVTHINFFEADAFARWKGMRLLTEFEWEVAASMYGRQSKWNHFQESNYYQPSIASDNQFFGTAWEWTNSAYLPYPFYKQAPGALGEYNGKFMINQMVLRGGSCATPASHFRVSYRNFFHPHLQWQFTGIRLAKYFI